MPGFYSEYPSFDRPVRGSNHNHGCTICQRNSWLRRHPNSTPKPQGSWLDGPHVPGPSKESIRALKCRDVEETSPSPKIGVQEAFGLACKALEGYHREAIVCINQSKWSIYHREDLPFMVFDQLDKELFRSVLKGHVYLSWSRSPQAATKRAEEDSKITIELPEWFKVEANSISILATLVHQMVHAYYLQCCGYQDKDVRGPAYNLGHGFEFKGLLRLIGNCCPESASRYLWEPLRQPRGYSDRFWQSQPQAGRSNCSSFRNHYPTGPQRLDCKQWCDEAIAVTNSLADSRQAQEKRKQIEDTPSAKSQETSLHFLQPDDSLKAISRSDYTLFKSPESYIEIHFHSQAYPVLRKDIPHHLGSLAQSPCFSNDRILTLPPTSTFPSFIIFYRFLRGGGPSNPGSPLASAETFPIILPRNYVSSNELIDIITTYYLALNISFQPLAAHAISLLSTPLMPSDPVDFLRAIYNPPLPTTVADQQLRTWVQSWLSTCIPAHLVTIAGAYRTNFDILKNHPDYQGRFMTLRKNAAEPMCGDLEAAETEFQRKYRYAYPQLPVQQPHPPELYQSPWLQGPRLQPPVPHLQPLAQRWPQAFPLHGQGNPVHPQQIPPQQIHPQQIPPQQIPPQQIPPQQIHPQQIPPQQIHPQQIPQLADQVRQAFYPEPLQLFFNPR